MLQRININNIALIDSLELEFKPGFNVLTGETGAGKSIIIDAVNFVLGERTSRDIIKYGCNKAKVEAVFRVDNAEPVNSLLRTQELELEDGELILARELSSAGKNVCRINGTLVPLAFIKQVSDILVDIHGQHEHQSLLDPENHTDYLDAFDHDRVIELKSALEVLCSEHRKLVLEKNGGFGTEAERTREIDILSYQIEEINNAALTVGEDIALSEEKAVLINAERIRSAFEMAYAAIAGEQENNVLSLLDDARRSIRDIASLSPEYESTHASIEELYYNAEEASFAIRDKLENLEFNDTRLEEIEERLERISSLKRKYGDSIESIIQFAENAQEKLDKLINAEARIEELKKLIAAAEKKYSAIDDELSSVRRTAADSMRKQVLGHMADLGLAKADFTAAYSKRDGLDPKGTLGVEFMLTTNPGEPLRPLAKVASGGELSRIMLCFKTIFADNDKIGTLIFDEIDTGISGKVAAVVGEKMLGIAGSHQVICITHLPQIAALADAHFAVEKHDDGNHTMVDVKLLDDEGKYRRLAQMMDGDPDSEYAYEHAKQLAERAKEIKSRS